MGLGRIRTYKPEFFIDEKTGTLSSDAKVVFLGLISHADRNGVLKHTLRELRALIFSHQPDIDMQPLLDEIESKPLISTYEVAGRKYIKILHFLDHQVINSHEAQSRLPDALDLQKNARANNKRTKMTVRKGKERNGMEGREETRARVKAALPKKATRASPLLSSARITEEFLSELQAKPAYQAVDVRHVYAKMRVWCETKGKQVTADRLVNWLNREEPPKAGSVGVKPKQFDPGRRVPAPAAAKPVDVQEVLKLAAELDEMGLKDQAAAVRAGVKA